MGRPMPQLAVRLGEYRDDAVALVEGVERARVSAPAGSTFRRLLTPLRIESLYEASYLRFFAAWEDFLEQSFLRYLCGYENANGPVQRVAGTRYEPTLTAARNTLYGPRPFILSHKPYPHIQS